MNQLLLKAQQNLSTLSPLQRPGSFISLLLLSLLPMIGGWWVWEVTHKNGAGLSPDSVNYLYMARQVVAGNGFQTIDPKLVSAWSPGYTLFLAVIALCTGADPFQFAHIVNMILFASTILLGGYIGWHTMGGWSPFLWVAVAMVAFSDDLLSIYAMAWSEPLFIVLTLLLFIALHHYRVQRTHRNLFMLTVFGAGVCLARYSGLVAVPVVFLAILIGGQEKWRTRLGHGILFAVGSVVPVALWMLRNLVTTGTAMGERFPSQTPLMTHLTRTAHTILTWYMDDSMVAGLQVLDGVAVIAGIALVEFGIIWWRDRKKTTQYLRDYGAMLVFMVAYAAFMIASATQVHFDPINPRLLAPIFIPLTLAVCALTQQVIQSIPYRLLQGGAVVFACGLGAMVVGQQLVETQQFVIANRDNGVEGIRHIQLEQNETLAYFGQMNLPASVTIYTPYLELLYYRTGRIGFPIPRRGATLADLQRDWFPTPGYLLWFEGAEYSFPSIEELRQIATITEIETFEDGAIFRIEKK